MRPLSAARARDSLLPDTGPEGWGRGGESAAAERGGSERCEEQGAGRSRELGHVEEARVRGKSFREGRVAVKERE